MARRTYDPAKKQIAFQWYAGGHPLHDIARWLSVPYATLHGWHTRERWAGRLKQMRADLFEKWEQGHNLAAVNMDTPLEDLVNAFRSACSDLSGAAVELSGAPSTTRLLAFSRAANACARVAGRVLAVMGEAKQPAAKVPAWYEGVGVKVVPVNAER